MKRTALGLAAFATLMAPAATAYADALPVYVARCGATGMVLCGVCVQTADVTRCVYW